MRPPETELRDIGLFIRTTLSRFVKGEKPKLPEAELNWRKLQGITRGRNLGPLFAKCYKDAPLPPPVINDWQLTSTATSVQNLARLKVATDITAIAEKAGIKAVAMRGIVLANTIYPNPADRPMHDIDFLISPSACEKFLSAMHEAGHEPTEFFRSQYVYTIQNVVVEVHWHLLSNKRYREKINSDQLINSAVRVDVGNGFYYRLTDTWEIIGLVVHAFTHHNLSQIYSLIDIGLYMHNNKVDWQQIADWSKEVKISRMMHLTFGFTNHLFNLDFNPEILNLFCRKNRSRKFYQAYLAQTLTRISLKTHLRIKQSQFFVAETLGNKFREFLRLFSPKERRFLAEQIKAAFTGRKQKLKA